MKSGIEKNETREIVGSSIPLWEILASTLSYFEPVSVIYTLVQINWSNLLLCVGQREGSGSKY